MYALIVQNSVSQYPYSIKSLKTAYPNVSFPKDLSSDILNVHNVYLVQKTDRPAVTYEQNAVEVNPVLENGEWVQKWNVEVSSSDEISSRISHETVAVRSQRDDRLKNSDWTQMPDSPLSDASKALWATYRQSLRDMTNQSGFPFSVTYPDEPS